MRPLSHSEPRRGCAGGRFSRFRPPLPPQPCLLQSAATCILLMVQPLGLCTGSAYCPGLFSPGVCTAHAHTFLLVFSKRDLFFVKKTLKDIHLFILFGFLRSQLQPERSLLHHAGFFLAVYELSGGGMQASFLRGVWDLRSPTMD